MATSLFGCRKITDVIDGGQTDNSSYDAPKKIESREIVDLDVSFFIFMSEIGDDDYSNFYHFTIKDKVLSEDMNLNCSIDIDDVLLDEVQNIIERYDLVSMNGYDKHTAGLAPEYQPCYFTAIYESGEKLYFSENNNPYAAWAIDLFRLFRKAFIAAGHDELRPSDEATAIERFSFEFNDGNLACWYCEMKSEDGELMLFRQISDLSKDGESSESFAKFPEGFYERLQEVVEKSELRRFNGEERGGGSSNTDRYFDIYVDYRNGKQICGASVSPAVVEEFSKEIGSIRSFLDPIFD